MKKKFLKMALFVIFATCSLGATLPHSPLLPRTTSSFAKASRSSRKSTDLCPPRPAQSWTAIRGTSDLSLHRRKKSPYPYSAQKYPLKLEQSLLRRSSFSRCLPKQQKSGNPHSLLSVSWPSLNSELIDFVGERSRVLQQKQYWRTSHPYTTLPSGL